MFSRSLSIGMLLVAFAGCGRGPDFASVDGVVMLDGKPIADLEVQFIPDVTQGTNGPPISAYTDKEGRYRIAASGVTGVPVGKHRVCIRDASVMKPGGADAESGEAAPGSARPARRSRVPVLYGDAMRSPLGPVEVRPGTQTLDFDLKSKP